MLGGGGGGVDVDVDIVGGGGWGDYGVGCVGGGCVSCVNKVWGFDNGCVGVGVNS